MINQILNSLLKHYIHLNLLSMNFYQNLVNHKSLFTFHNFQPNLGFKFINHLISKKYFNQYL